MKSLLLIALSLHLFGQPAKPAETSETAFETQLLEFRHSLYPLLVSETESDYPLRLEAITQCINTFASQHAQELRRFREDRLRRIGRFKVELAPFKEEPLPTDLQKSADEQKNLWGPGLLLLDPMIHIYPLMTQALTQQGIALSDLNSFFVQSSLAGPLFQASQQPDGNWELVADYYRYAFSFTYHPDSGFMELKHFYRRKAL